MTAAADAEHSGQVPLSSIWWLAASWWIVAPAFGLLAIETMYERAVRGVAEPWLWLTGRPGLALAVGCLYVAAHWWCPAWYFMVVRSRVARRISAQEHVFKAACLLALLAFDHSPVSLWRTVANYLGIR